MLMNKLVYMIYMNCMQVLHTHVIYTKLQVLYIHSGTYTHTNSMYTTLYTYMPQRINTYYILYTPIYSIHYTPLPPSLS